MNIQIQCSINESEIEKTLRLTSTLSITNMNLFNEKEKLRKINVEQATAHHVPIDAYKSLKQGEDIINLKGDNIKNEWVTHKGSAAKSYAFCADTKYDETIIPHIKHADLIYHESTYLDDQVEKAELRYHSTSSQAATIALKSGTKKLLLGHFSSKYEDLNTFEQEAKRIFNNSEVSKEGVSYIV